MVIQEFDTNADILYSIDTLLQICVSICLFMLVISQIMIRLACIFKLKQHLFQNFQTKALGIVEYFLGTEIAQSKSKNFISQRKYALYFLEETGMIECRPTTIPMDRNASGGSPPPGW